MGFFFFAFRTLNKYPATLGVNRNVVGVRALRRGHTLKLNHQDTCFISMWKDKPEDNQTKRNLDADWMPFGPGLNF